MMRIGQWWKDRDDGGFVDAVSMSMKIAESTTRCMEI